MRESVISYYFVRKETTDMLHRTWVNVHLDILENNTQLLRGHLSDGCRMMGIVKADAYGHGAVAVAQRMAACGVEYFGVSNLDEAIELRRADIRQPILILSYTPPHEAARLARYGVSQTISSKEHGEALAAAAAKADVEVSVHVKVDTGMSRVGFVCHDADDVAAVASDIAAVCRLRGLKAEGIFTHFASADEREDDGFTREQFARFMAVVDAARALGVTFALRHCCNSAALLRYPEMHLDMVRPGIVQYGHYPSAWMRELLPGLQQVMELKTAVSQVKELPVGTPMSYNRTYAADHVTHVATVPIGYADGYARSMSNTAYMLVCGQPAPVIGRVCMDQCLLDVTAIDGVCVDTEVTVFGRDGEMLLPIEQIAEWASTINYEVICRISRRVPRRYLDNGKEIAQINYLLD
jgi:alanine racemase